MKHVSSSDPTVIECSVPEAVYQKLGSRVPPVRLGLAKQLAGDASDRRFYRVHIEDKSSILMVFPRWGSGYGGDPVSWLAMQNALNHSGMPVPIIHAVEPASASVWVEDFGNTFLCARLENGQLDDTNPEHATALKLYEESLQLLVEAQYPKHITATHLGFTRAFDYEKLRFELDFFVHHFLECLLGQSRSGGLIAGLTAEFDTLATALSLCPRVLAHRDYHSRNLMVHDNRVKWIDFQDARLGPHTYDVTSLLRDSYTRITPKTRSYLLNAYSDMINQRRHEHRLPAFPLEQMRLEALETGLQRNIKALGSFAYLARVRSKNQFLQYVRPTIATLLLSEFWDETPGYVLRYKHTLAMLHSIAAGELSPMLDNAFLRYPWNAPT